MQGFQSETLPFHSLVELRVLLHHTFLRWTLKDRGDCSITPCLLASATTEVVGRNLGRTTGGGQTAAADGEGEVSLITCLLVLTVFPPRQTTKKKKKIC